MGRHECDAQSLLWKVRSVLQVCHSYSLQLNTTYPGTRQEDLRLLPGLVEDGSIHKFIWKRLKQWGYSQVTGVRTVQKGHWQGVIEEIWVHTLTTCCTHRHKVINVPHSCNTRYMNHNTVLSIVSVPSALQGQRVMCRLQPWQQAWLWNEQKCLYIAKASMRFPALMAACGKDTALEIWRLICWYIDIEVLVEPATFIFSLFPNDGGSRLLWSIGTHLAKYRMSHHSAEDHNGNTITKLMWLWIGPSAATNNIIYGHFWYFLQQVDNLKNIKRNHNDQ